MELPFPITDLESRLVAADKAEEEGNYILAGWLKQVDQGFVLDGGLPRPPYSNIAWSNGSAPPLLKQIWGKRVRGKFRLAFCTGIFRFRWDVSEDLGYQYVNLDEPAAAKRAVMRGKVTAIVEGASAVKCRKNGVPTLYVHPLESHRFGITYVPAMKEKSK